MAEPKYPKRTKKPIDTWDEGGARAGRARPVGEGEPVVDPIQASASDVPGSAGEAVGPHRALHPVVPCKGRLREKTRRS